MPRASKYLVEGYTYHVTHRCHNRDFHLRFARDRNWLREGIRRHSWEPSCGSRVVRECVGQVKRRGVSASSVTSSNVLELHRHEVQGLMPDIPKRWLAVVGMVVVSAPPQTCRQGNHPPRHRHPLTRPAAKGTSRIPFSERRYTSTVITACSCSRISTCGQSGWISRCGSWRLRTANIISPETMLRTARSWVLN